MPHEECKRFEEDKPIWLRLRRQCLRFVMDHAQEVAAARPEMPRELSDRSVQIWEPLVVLADLAGGDWPRLAREAAVGLSGAAATNSPIGSLLFDIWFLFATEGSGRIFSRVLVQGLNSRASNLVCREALVISKEFLGLPRTNTGCGWPLC